MSNPVDYYDPAGLSAVFYDLIHEVIVDMKADAAFYADLLPAGGSVLDFGCGTGRVLFDLASRGHLAVGVDLSQPMLYRAGLRLQKLPSDVQARVALIQSDMADVEIQGRFDLVAITFFSLGHVPLDRRPDVFANVARHLAPDGVAAVHLPSARLMAIPPPKGPDEPVLSVQYSAAGDRLELYVAAQSFDGVRFEQLLDYVMRDGQGQEVRRSHERLVYFNEDPRVAAASAGLVAVGEPTDLGMGEAFLFRHV